MKVSTDLDALKEGEQVLLFCLVGTQITCCLARLHWFADEDSGKTTTRTLAYQSTWNGDRLPAEWKPYAWATFEAPDPAGADVI